MRVAVIGGGIAGLVSAYKAARQGAQVTVFEREPVLGGLAASFAYGDARIERYYHFLCRTDEPYFRLLEELGMSDELVWVRSQMGYYVDGRRFAFGTPESLLGFSPLSLPGRLRFGLATLRDRSAHDWRGLDEVSAREWLIGEYGREGFDVVWRPLLDFKWGRHADDVSAAWMWARINRIARSHEAPLFREHLGYLRGGTRSLIDALVARIEAAGGTLRPDTPAEQIVIADGRVTGVRTAGGDEPFDAVISAVAAPLLADLAPGLPEAFTSRLRGIEHYGVVAWVLVADEPLGEEFWLNISDSRVPVSGVITYTNLNPMPELGGAHLLYIPMYRDASQPGWDEVDGELPALLSALDTIRPGFSAGVRASWRVSDRNAQPLFGVGFERRFGALGQPATPVEGLLRTDMSQIYPDDRSIVNAIDKAAAVAAALARLGE